jgi:hypothetical protein
VVGRDAMDAARAMEDTRGARCAHRWCWDCTEVLAGRESSGEGRSTLQRVGARRDGTTAARMMGSSCSAAYATGGGGARHTPAAWQDLALSGRWGDAKDGRSEWGGDVYGVCNGERLRSAGTAGGARRVRGACPGQVRAEGWDGAEGHQDVRGGDERGVRGGERLPQVLGTSVSWWGCAQRRGSRGEGSRWWWRMRMR